MNVFSEKGVEYLSFLHSINFKKAITSQTMNSVLEILNCLKLKKGWHLGLRIAQGDGLGDESRFYTYHGNPTSEDPYKDMDRNNFIEAIKNNDINLRLGEIMIEPTEMGAWQAYLLMVSHTVLPTFWHGGYIRKTFIFQGNEKIKVIGRVKTDDVVSLGDYDTEPYVIEQDSGYRVSCCYWNDWQGLIRENMLIPIQDGYLNASEAKYISGDVLFSFDCGIRY